MVVARHRELWTRRGLQVVASGDIDPDHLAARLEAGLKGLPAGEPPAPPAVGPARIPAGVVDDHVGRKQNQTVVLCAWPGPRSTDEERVPLMLLRELLNGQSGRLFEQLRNRRSLCYNTGILGTAGFGQGMLVGYVLTAPETAAEARDALVAELAGMAVAPAGGAEFERARKQLLGNLRISSQSNGARVGRTLRDRVYGRGANDLESLVAAVGACTPADVVRAAAAFIDPDRRFEVTLGP
jgi:zinc protease